MAFLAIALLTGSCANYKLHYSKEGKKWEAQAPEPDRPVAHTLYLIGDAGNASLDGSLPVLDYLKQRLANEGEQSSILFLGDNIYYDGLPPEDASDYPLAEHRLRAQLDILRDFKGLPLFIPGNHDWRNGLEGLHRQEKYVNAYINGLRGVEDEDAKGWQPYFLPSSGCAGIEVVEINDDLVFIIVDTEWYVTNWDKHPSINAGCEVKNRQMFQFLFETTLRKNRDKTVVVALHHPLYTNGPHGGKFPAKAHLFPLTEKYHNLYIPLPGLGTLYAVLRGTIGSRQDLPHQIYQEMKRGMLAGAQKNGEYIFVSGHEHALQYFADRGQHFIVSGSGSKRSPVGGGRGAQFAYGKEGFAAIDFYEGGEAWVQFWVVGEDGTDAKMVFRQQIKKPSTSAAEGFSSDYSAFENQPDSVRAKPIRMELAPAGKAREFFLGKHYRELYLEEYSFPTLDLGAYAGGLVPVSKGGGAQTNSLRMSNAAGQQFVLRDMTKDVSRLLPFPINKMTVANSLVLDNFLSSHPFAALAVPPLAQAIDVYHTQPEIYYVYNQPALGTFSESFSNGVYLLERRPGGDWSGTAMFGGADKLISTSDLVDKITSKNLHRVDQAWALRSRMLDLLIGDWDRHDDQWRWARFEQEGSNGYVYRPVPRDRDQAFSRYDGLVTQAARVAALPTIRQLQTYGPELGNLKWDIWSPRRFDNTFLNELSWQDWAAQAAFIQSRLTDEVIEQAFAAWPPEAQLRSAGPIKAALKKRRDDLLDIAQRHYRLLAEKVDVFGTDQPERFEIVRASDREVRVAVYRLGKKGEPKEKVYERIFDCSITKEIAIYGLGGDDEFHVSGQVQHSILVRLIGGQGQDTFQDESSVKGMRKMTMVYDGLQGAELEAGTEGKDLRRRRRIFNLYDRTASHYEYDMFMPLPFIGGNPDDGLALGVDLNWITYAFKREPYGARHRVLASYAFDTKAYFVDYSGDFINAFGHFDFLLNATARGPAYAFNYFGFGNGAQADFEAQDIDFYRVRQSLLRLNPAWKCRIAANSGHFTLGPVFERRQAQATPGRLIASDELGLREDFFDAQYFAGAAAGFQIASLDNWVIPHRGIRFNTTLNWLSNLQQSDRHFAALRADVAFYQNLDARENIVLATRLGLGHNIGDADDYDFYHAPNLGGREGLRGYRSERFYGQTAFWQNIDIRTRLFSSYNQMLPFTFGIFAGFDHGRVWSDEDDADTWHYNYGGGLWMAPADALTLSLGAFRPREPAKEEPLRLAFRLGVGF